VDLTLFIKNLSFGNSCLAMGLPIRSIHLSKIIENSEALIDYMMIFRMVQVFQSPKAISFGEI